MFGLNETMYPLMMVAFLAALGGALFIDVLFSLLFGAKSKRKMSVGYVLSALFLSPFLEELFMRGPIWFVADGEFSLFVWTVIVVLAVFFGLFHGIISQKTREKEFEELNGAGICRWVVSAGITGIVFGWLVVATDSLLPAMIVHAAYNLMALSITGVTRSIQNNS